jgi:hypothetical protein
MVHYSQDRRRFYPLTFIGSIVWIAGFAYLMNWWAAVIGETAGIKEQVSCSVIQRNNWGVGLYVAQ